MTPAEHTLFIADLHLHAASADTIALALKFIEDTHGASALYILGDLVEYWLGDDAGDTCLDAVFESLTALSASGTAVHLMHGNRDFLLGADFARRIGATLHSSDTVTIQLGTQPILLLHGDTLCTDDHDYQALRRMLRDPVWQADFLSKPVIERIRQAEVLRDRSRAAVADKQTGIMDVNQATVHDTFARFDCQLMIHGHTHRPAEHELEVQGKTCRRLVLGDWHAEHACIVRWDGAKLQLETYPRR